MTALSIFAGEVKKHYHVTTPWKFTTSAGISGGLSLVGVAGGSLYLKNYDTKEEGRIRYGGVGVGISPLPGSLTFSTTDMWSKGLGSVYAAKGPLTLDDMRGPMCVLGGAISYAEGGSGSIYFLGFPVALALLGGAIEIILSGLLTARACGFMVGNVIGVDAGISLLPGYAH
jgi:hypothetical protein